MISLMRPTYIFDAHALKHAIKVRRMQEIEYIVYSVCCSFVAYRNEHSVSKGNDDKVVF